LRLGVVNHSVIAEVPRGRAVGARKRRREEDCSDAESFHCCYNGAGATIAQAKPSKRIHIARCRCKNQEHWRW
jgi:hypothetical protein